MAICDTTLPNLEGDFMFWILLADFKYLPIQINHYLPIIIYRFIHISDIFNLINIGYFRTMCIAFF